MKEKLYLLLSLVNQSTFWSEFSSTHLVPFAVLGTPMKGYQKSGMVQFAILVPFTISDSGNRNNCVLYRNVPLSGNEPKDAYIHRCFSSSHGSHLDPLMMLSHSIAHQTFRETLKMLLSDIFPSLTPADTR